MGISVPDAARIRRASHRDHHILHQLEVTHFGDDQFSRSQLRHLITRANATTYVLEMDGKIVGSAIMVWRKNSRIGRLYSILISNEVQGRGLGKLLLTKCEADAKKRGCTRVSLEVRADNRPAIALYLKYGYEIIDSLPGYYADGSNGLKMLKKLS
ncbi:GNAT family N-acetyltransferase [candidate division GN15 bacterium]|uniref:GNAT family N-acetyltransferase n=1 Tax=candidate division GN15 bacterium TaxID=2072418 RepID=A0A855WZF4_9BACT|nr:MAG: GNAT family N-acetyltransferase [candidate division GN15 bacterium]